MRFLLTMMLLLGLQILPAQAEVPDFSGIASEEEFLPVDQAFRLEAVAAGENRLSLRWVIAPGYALYKSRMSASMAQVPAEGMRLSGLQFLSPSTFKNDPSFGRMEVFHDDARAVLEAQNVPALAAGKTLSVLVNYQGCADAGLCYPPIKKTVVVQLAATTVANAAAGAAEPMRSEQDLLADKIRDGSG